MPSRFPRPWVRSPHGRRRAARVLAAAADADPERVMVSAAHQPDAPVDELEVELALPQLPGLDRPGMVPL